MWGAYHRLRTADSFVCDWRVFLAESVQCKAFPAFYQYITHHIFKTLIKTAYPVRISVHDEPPDRPLTSEEQNALRYVAGYVVRKLRIKFESESHPKKDELIFLLMECAGDEANEEGGTETWLNLVDRGGLWHVNDLTYGLFMIMEEVNDLTYGLFMIMEEVTRQYFSTSERATTVNVIRDSLLKSNDILFQWSLIAAVSDGYVESTVLFEIIKLYVTIRGYAFTKSCMELYKQAKRKTIPKSRALRSNLFVNH